jgi:hypothetical protein
MVFSFFERRREFSFFFVIRVQPEKEQIPLKSHSLNFQSLCVDSRNDKKEILSFFPLKFARNCQQIKRPNVNKFSRYRFVWLCQEVDSSSKNLVHIAEMSFFFIQLPLVSYFANSNSVMRTPCSHTFALYVFSS